FRNCPFSGHRKDISARRRRYRPDNRCRKRKDMAPRRGFDVRDELQPHGRGSRRQHSACQGRRAHVADRGRRGRARRSGQGQAGGLWPALWLGRYRRGAHGSGGRLRRNPGHFSHRRMAHKLTTMITEFVIFIIRLANQLIEGSGYVAYAYPRAVRISLGLPTRKKDGKVMANFELLNDEVVMIPILTDDASGDPVPAPSGDTFTVVSSNPASLGAAIGATAAGNPAVVLTPLVRVS